MLSHLITALCSAHVIITSRCTAYTPVLYGPGRGPVAVVKAARLESQEIEGSFPALAVKFQRNKM